MWYCVIMPCKVVSTVSTVDENQCVTIQMKAIEQYRSVYYRFSFCIEIV